MKNLRYKPLLLLVIVFLTACGEEEKETPKKEVNASESTVMVVRKNDLNLMTVKNVLNQNSEIITGRVIPKNQTQLLSEVQGRIMRGAYDFKTGVSFRRGQPIIRINSTEFALNLEAQRSSFLNILTGMMPDMKSDYPESYPNWLAYISNYKIGASLPELPATKSTSERYFVTSSQVYSTFYSIKAQEERLTKYTILAPFDGMLSNTLVDEGGLVSPGQPLGTFISNNAYEIEAAASISLTNRLRVGDQVAFKASNLEGSFMATVVRIADLIDNQTQNIPIYFSVQKSNLKAGVYLEGKVATSSYENSFVVPSKIIERDNAVYILEQGVIKKQNIEILSVGRDSTVVRGLKDNQQLILNKFNSPVTGLKISQNN